MAGRDDPGLDRPGQIFLDDPSRLFISNGDGTFTERSSEAELVDRGQGRGVVCFDYDRDGDVDIFVANNSGQHALYRNEGGNQNNFLTVRLSSPSPNSKAVGARIYLTLGSLTQMRETKAGNNYVSQQPDEVYFGLGKATHVDELRVLWPNGQLDVYRNLPANQFLLLEQGPPRLRSGWHRRRR